MGDINKFLTDFKEVYNQLNYNEKLIYLHSLKFYFTDVDDNFIDEKSCITYFHEQEDEKYFLN